MTKTDPSGWVPTDEMVEWAYADATFTNAGEDARVVFRRWLEHVRASAYDRGYSDGVDGRG